MQGQAVLLHCANMLRVRRPLSYALHAPLHAGLPTPRKTLIGWADYPDCTASSARLRGGVPLHGENDN
jgi:hypothetical protein